MSNIKIIVLFFTLVFTFSNCKKLRVQSEVDYLVDAENVKIIHNPNGNVPLSARLSFIPNFKVNCEVYVNNVLKNEFMANYTDSIVLNILTFELGTETNIQLKVYEPQTNNFQTFENKFTVIDEGILPEIEVPKINNNQDQFLCLMYQGLGTRLNTIPFVFDDSGNIIWYFKDPHKSGIITGFEFLSNGNFFFAFDKKIYEMDWMGDFIDSIDVSPFIPHHDLIELSSGNYLFPASREGSEKSFDFLIEVDPISQQLIHEIDLNLILDWDRNEMESPQNDKFHINSVWEDETDGAIIVSLKNQGIVKIDLSGNLLWILSPHLGWKEEFRDKLLLPVNANGIPYNSNLILGYTSAENFDYCWSQHAAIINRNGNLEVFDNGVFRNFSNYGLPFSRVVEYEIDEINKTVKQIWKFKGVKKKDFYSSIGGDVDDLNNGTTLMLSGTNWNYRHTALIYEMDKNSETIETKIKFIFKDSIGSGIDQFLQYDYLYRAEKTKVPTIF